MSKQTEQQAYVYRLNTVRAAVEAQISTSIVASWGDNLNPDDSHTVGQWQTLEDMCHGASLAMAMAGLHDLSDDYGVLANIAGQHKWDARRRSGDYPGMIPV